MEYTPGDYPSDECYQDTHSDCGGYRADTKNTIALAGGKVPSYMQMAPEGVVIVVSLCSCTCHDRKALREKDEQVFAIAYNTTVNLWGTSVREGSWREAEDREYDTWLEEQRGGTSYSQKSATKDSKIRTVIVCFALMLGGFFGGSFVAVMVLRVTGFNEELSWLASVIGISSSVYFIWYYLHRQKRLK